MKSKMKSITWLLMLCLGTMSLVQSCQKDACEPCKNTPCDKLGFIAGEPFGCIVPPELAGTIGIQGDDGVFYHIRKDRTGNFTKYDVGAYVQFGLCAVEDYDDGKSAKTSAIWAAPKKIGDLGCVKIAHSRNCPNTCSQEAQVVAVTYTPNGDPSTEHYLMVNNVVYAVQGDFQQRINELPAGSYVTIGYEIMEDCILQTVVTYPSIEGCLRVTCLKESIANLH